MLEKYINKIYCGDTIDFMQKSLPDKCIDLIVTDPPYLMNYRTNRRKDKTHQFTKPIQNDDNEELVAAYIKECYRILKDDTAMYMFCNSNKVDWFKQEIEKYFVIKNMIIWVKNNHTAGDLEAAFGKQYEIIFLANKGRCKIRGKRLTDVWYFDKISGQKQVHQNQKPVELLERCVLSHSDEGNLIYDGFLGVGSTAIAALKNKRNFIGCEIEREYCQIARDRITKEVY